MPIRAPPQALSDAVHGSLLALLKTHCFVGGMPESVAAGHLRSLHLLLAGHANVKGGWVFSSRPYEELPEQRLTFLPIYYAGSVVRER